MDMNDTGNINKLGCQTNIDNEDTSHIELIRFWLQCILPLIIGLIGLMGNCVSIPVLCSKKLSSVFNRILVFLAIFDNIFILCGILSVVRKNYDSSYYHICIHAYFLYQMSAISIVCSIWTTVMLALERFFVITRPTEYHIATQGANPWKRVLSYIFPVITFSIIFNIPKFFEIQISETMQRELRTSSSNSNETYFVNVSKLQLAPTHLRMHNDYILYYQNLAKLIVTGIIPFAALCFFNLKIYKALRKRHTSGILSGNANQSSEDTRNAILLFGIVFIFLVTNVWRIIINLYELIYIRGILTSLSIGCDPIPLWLHISADISELLLVLNSSINFFLYCFMSSGFRSVLSNALHSISDPFVRKCRLRFKNATSQRSSSINSEVRMRLSPMKNRSHGTKEERELTLLPHKSTPTVACISSDKIIVSTTTN